LGGVIFWEVVAIPQREVSVNLLDEAWNRNLINIFSSPVSKAEFLLALVILGLIKVSVTSCTLIIGAFILYQFNVFSTYSIYIPLLIINLVLFGFLFGFFINGLILRFGYNVAEFAWALIALISPFSCIYYPLSILPWWAQKIALLLPTTYVFEEMRRIVITGSINAVNMEISFLINVFYFFLSLIFFNLMFENAREHGRLVKLN
jgi:ABC-2 type transport system permease protein